MNVRSGPGCGPMKYAFGGGVAADAMDGVSDVQAAADAATAAAAIDRKALIDATSLRAFAGARHAIVVQDAPDGRRVAHQLRIEHRPARRVAVPHADSDR